MGHKLTAADVVKRTLTFEHGGESLVIDLGETRVIDCTGCWSKVRRAMQEADASFAVTETPWNVSFRLVFTGEKPSLPAPLDDPKAHYIFSTANMYCS